MIIMVGYPASGKSFISKYISNNHNYIIINQDTLKTKAKCKLECIKNINNNKSIIIDATNPNKESRKFYIDIAKEHNYKISIYHMTTSKELSMHNNYYRSLINNIKSIPTLVYNIYKSKFEKPELTENVFEIIKINHNTPIDPIYYLYLY